MITKKRHDKMPCTVLDSSNGQDVLYRLAMSTVSSAPVQYRCCL